jgi:two-component system sensor histidine kinase KdpD
MDSQTEPGTAAVTQSNLDAKAKSRMSWKAVRNRLGILRGCLAGLVAVALVTFFAFRLHLNLSTSGFLYFLIVVMISVVWGFWEASVTSLIAVGCLNYFFIPPVFTWTVSDPQNWVALATFEIAALTVSQLSTTVQEKARAEARQRMEVQKLYDLSRRILLLDRRQTIGPQIVSLIQEIFRTESAALFDATSARMDATGHHADDLDQLARDAYFQDKASRAS